MNSNILKTPVGIGCLVVLGFVAASWYRSSQTLPQSFMLAVPFTTQAPNNNWDRNEDCEETSITMANAFLGGDRGDKLPAARAQESINALKTWEGKNLGYNANTGTDATTRMATGAFGLKVETLSDYSADDLKQALREGHPILLSVNAKVLNPAQYEVKGPLYHMIVVLGYDGENFTVHDPGTNSGARNVYSFTELKNSAADWDQGTKTIQPSTKNALVLSK
jgi:uncharacterized protein YvpB